MRYLNIYFTFMVKTSEVKQQSITREFLFVKQTETVLEFENVLCHLILTQYRQHCFSYITTLIR